MQNEAQIEAECVQIAVQAGWMVRKLAYPGRRGAPDRMFVKNGVVWFVEFKDPRGKLSALQAHELGLFRGEGIAADVISSVADFKCALAMKESGR